jgi:hypothetical protein
MNFSRQDAITFAIGLGAALAIQLGTAFVQLDGGQVADWGQWSIALATGLASAGGRYVVTELTQRGFGGG